MEGTNYELARLIMYENFVSPLIGIYGFNADEKRGVGHLTRAPYSKETLLGKKDSYILVGVPPISMLEMNEKFNDSFFLRKNLWFANHKFAKDASSEWHLVAKTADPAYFKKNWIEQTNCLPEGHRVSTVQTVVYTMLAHHRFNGKQLFKNTVLRCADVPGGRGSSKHVCVTFAPGTIFINECDDMVSAPNLGLATEIIPE